MLEELLGSWPWRQCTRGLPRDRCEVRAAIVTCGGLCPGLNSVIREAALADSDANSNYLLNVRRDELAYVQAATPDASSQLHHTTCISTESATQRALMRVHGLPSERMASYVRQYFGDPAFLAQHIPSVMSHISFAI